MMALYAEQRAVGENEKFNTFILFENWYKKSTADSQGDLMSKKE